MSIKILVVTHKDYWMPNENIYLPILVGLFFLIPTRSDREEKTENTVKNK